MRSYKLPGIYIQMDVANRLTGRIFSRTEAPKTHRWAVIGKSWCFLDDDRCYDSDNTGFDQRQNSCSFNWVWLARF
ncbi:hypothetical protein V2G26_012454 [Clonostachys chloroleuca]